jgi:hypothetical protein
MSATEERTHGELQFSLIHIGFLGLANMFGMNLHFFFVLSIHLYFSSSLYTHVSTVKCVSSKCSVSPTCLLFQIGSDSTACFGRDTLCWCSPSDLGRSGFIICQLATTHIFFPHSPLSSLIPQCLLF